jgi:ABC-type multidrug transport system fused ATPase/permease subunit
MSTDVERIMIGLLDIHEFWANLVQVAVACWLLQRELGMAFMAPLVVVFITAVLAAVVAKLITPRQRAWMEAIQTRVAVTADTLAHMKSIKLTGMIKPVQDHLQSLRVKEIKFGSRWRILLACTAAISQGPMLLSPVLTFAFTTSSLGTSTVFVSIAYLTLLASPLMILFQRFPQLVSALVCLGRIQMFLEKEERLDYRHAETHAISEDLTGLLLTSPDAKSGAIELQAPPRTPWEPCVKVSNGSFGWSPHAHVLTNVNFHIPTCQLTIVTGPVGTGKSTLCRALLGEIPFAKGTISMSRDLRIGYCDQKPFLYNSSIRDNIIGFDEFMPERYDTVLYATKIDEDVKSLALRDQTVVGSGGIALSGGQRQRLSIARALYQRGMNILIFDDILSGLDAITEEHVFEHVFGRQGLLQQNQITTILCTHDSRRLLAANHIIRLEGDGTLAEEGQISENQADLVLLPLSIKKTDEPSECDVESAPSSPPITIASSGNFTSLQQSSARRLGDAAVYKYYFESIGVMPMVIFLVAGLCYGFLANFPRVWLTFWAQDADRGSGANHSYAYYLGIYSLLQISCLVSGMISLLVVLVAFIRQSGAVLHQRLLETISTATLTLYTLTDIGVLTNYFSQDMNLIDSELPLAFLNILLDLASVIGMAALLASASPWLILAYPGLILILWYLQHFYLRTSRQVRLLDLEAKSPLYAHFLDTLKGITTIRAFGWVGHSMARHKQLLEQSQRATYMRSMIQRWLFLALGIIVMIVATALVALITQIGARADISGASLVTLMTFSQSLTDIVRFYAALETSIGSVARLKSFMATTDSEVKPGRDVKPDNNWPSTGRLVLQNAWASYKYVLITSSSIFVHVC